MGILKDHILYYLFLRPGVISIQNQEEKKYFVEEGTVEFSNNNLLILRSLNRFNNLNQNSIKDILNQAKKN